MIQQTNQLPLPGLIGNADLRSIEIMKYKLSEKFSWVDTSSEAYQQAIDSIMLPFGPGIVTILGPGGSGKSILYQIAYNEYKGRVLPLASTGGATSALIEHGIPALTIHAALKIKPSEWYQFDRKKSIYSAILLSGADLVLIDEISMISSNFLDYLLELIAIANNMREKQNKQHLRLVLFGDLMQLPPVIDSSNETLMQLYDEKYTGYFFFNANRYKQSARKTIELYDVYRQNDQRLISILNAVRFGRVSQEDIDYLNKRVIDMEEFKKRHPSHMYLCSTNDQVNMLNAEYLKKFKGKPSMTYVTQYKGDVKPEDFPFIPQMQTFYIGEQVMCLKNGENYKNGTIGTIIDFTDKDGPVVQSGDNVFTVDVSKWEKTKLKVVDGELKQEVIGWVKAIACKVSYASTFHKAQGLTLDAAILDFKGWLAPSSVYLGLSRLRNISGLCLSAPLKRNLIRVNPEALGFFEEDDHDIVQATYSEQGELPF